MIQLPAVELPPGFFMEQRQAVPTMPFPNLEHACEYEIVVHFPSYVWGSALCCKSDRSGWQNQGPARAFSPPPPPPPHPGLHQDSLWQQELFPAVTRDAAIALLPSPASTASTPGCHCHHDPAQTLTVSLAVTFIAYGAEGCCSATAAPSPGVPPLLLRFPGLES